jgi:uncharacterized membrane protein
MIKKVIIAVTAAIIAVLMALTVKSDFQTGISTMCMVGVFVILFLSYFYFEQSNAGTKEIAIIATLSAFATVGRIIFAPIPNVKPVTFLVALTGFVFGPYDGFLVGSTTAFLSNIFFGQGPWTPWQMFAMGLIGFLAGVLFKKGLLRRDRISMAVFGGIAVFIIYGGIMDPASAIMFQDKINWPIIATYMVMGVPINLVHASATVFFLLLIGEPMLEKLDRIKIKYGLMEE